MAKSPSIDAVTVQLQEELKRSADFENVVLDMEATIGQFRELVSNLQKCVEP